MRDSATNAERKVPQKPFKVHLNPSLYAVIDPCRIDRLVFGIEVPPELLRRLFNRLVASPPRAELRLQTRGF